jgi:hypothetical protein
MTGRVSAPGSPSSRPRSVARRCASPEQPKANVVALHPTAIAVYLDAVEQLAKALSASDAKAACLKLRELIDCIVVAPRVRPGDPIRFEVRGRLAALMQPDPGKVSVGALVPRERNPRSEPSGSNSDDLACPPTN